MSTRNITMLQGDFVCRLIFFWELDKGSSKLLEKMIIISKKETISVWAAFVWKFDFQRKISFSQCTKAREAKNVFSFEKVWILRVIFFVYNVLGIKCFT